MNFTYKRGYQKRKRRDYRIARKAAFTRPEPGFSLYEGRTRGKKLKYTYSDDEDIFSDDGPRRSTRNASGTATPAEPAGPRFTASGRQIRSRAGGLYGASLLTGQRDDEAEDEEDTGRPQRSRTTRANGYAGYDVEDESEAQSSGNEWQGGDDDEENDFEGDDEEEASGDESVMNGENPSLVVQLRYSKGKTGLNGTSEEQPANEPANEQSEQQSFTQQGPGVGDTAPEVPAGPDSSKMQLDVAPAAEQSSESQKAPNGIIQGATEDPQPVAGIEASAGQPVAFRSANETEQSVL